MKELYEMIEKKIRESGYPRPIVGSDVYDDICDQCQSVIFCGQFNTCPSVPLPTPAFALV